MLVSLFCLVGVLWDGEWRRELSYLLLLLLLLLWVFIAFCRRSEKSTLWWSINYCLHDAEKACFVSTPSSGVQQWNQWARVPFGTRVRRPYFCEKRERITRHRQVVATTPNKSVIFPHTQNNGDWFVSSWHPPIWWRERLPYSPLIWINIHDRKKYIKKNNLHHRDLVKQCSAPQ